MNDTITRTYYPNGACKSAERPPSFSAHYTDNGRLHNLLLQDTQAFKEVEIHGTRVASSLYLSGRAVNSSTLAKLAGLSDVTELKLYSTFLTADDLEDQFSASLISLTTGDNEKLSQASVERLVVTWGCKWRDVDQGANALKAIGAATKAAYISLREGGASVEEAVAHLVRNPACQGMGQQDVARAVRDHEGKGLSDAIEIVEQASKS